MNDVFEQLMRSLAAYSVEQSRPKHAHRDALRELMTQIWSQLTPSQKLVILQSDEAVRLTDTSSLELRRADEIADELVYRIAQMERELKQLHNCQIVEGLGGYYWTIGEDYGVESFSAREDAVVHAYQAWIS